MRTLQAAVIFALAVITLALAWWGRSLAKKADAAVRERDRLEERIEATRALKTERLAVSHRLKLLHGKLAQLEATSAPEEETAKIAADIVQAERRLAEINGAIGGHPAEPQPQEEPQPQAEAAPAP
jgi:hypothetical protein